jgi:hypothetical protein
VAQGLFSIFLVHLPERSVLKLYRVELLVAVTTLIGFGVISLFVATTRLGLSPDDVLWQEAGTPLLFPQVLLACGIGAVLFFAFRSQTIAQWVNNARFLKRDNLELLISIFLWICAYSLWMSTPLRPSYNSSEPTAPNYQSYPLADSMIYDANAQGVFIGNAIPNDFTQKPFYSFFLVVLHAIAGQDYGHIIQLQVALSAFIPIIVYWIVREMSTRPAGLIAALMVILRERNSMSLSNVIQATHSRLLMSDVMAMGLIALLIWLTLNWLRRPDARKVSPMIMGGILGILMLTRLNSVLLLPFLVVLIALVLYPSRQYAKILQGTLLLALGISIPFGFWIWRNYQWTGRLSVQEPVAHYTEFVAKIYSFNP